MIQNQALLRSSGTVGESQRNGGWQGPLEVTSPSPWLKAGPATAVGQHRLHWGLKHRPRMETPQPLWAHSSVLALKELGVQGKECKVDDVGMGRGRREEADVSVMLLSLWHRRTCLKQSAWNS